MKLTFIEKPLLLNFQIFLMGLLSDKVLSADPLVDVQ